MKEVACPMNLFLRCACAARGKVIALRLYIYICKKKKNFQKSTPTQEGRKACLRLQYTLAAPEVFVTFLQILLVCRLGIGSALSETQTLTRSKPHPYGIAS